VNRGQVTPALPSGTALRLEALDRFVQEIRAVDVEQVVAAREVLDIRRQALLAIAVADVRGQLDTVEVAQMLSALADAAIDGAMRVAAHREARQSSGPLPRLAVIGMARLGGRELGYLGDVDVLWVHEPAAGQSAAAAAALAQAVARVSMGLLARPEIPGTVLHLDARLRPGGRYGAVSRTLAAYRSHYSRASGEDRQAVLRARWVAGDEELGQRFLAMVDGVRYRPDVSADDVAQLRRLQRRRETASIPAGLDRALHLEFGPGGLARVEFLAQILQLQHAHAVPDLRTTSTLAALEAATDAGLLDTTDQDVLRAGWIRASSMRSVIMLAGGVASDVIPSDPSMLTPIARLMGWHPADAVADLLTDYRRGGAETQAAIDRVLGGESVAAR
jgi:glutamate-ammonia-ligase adenylyltransferase